MRPLSAIQPFGIDQTLHLTLKRNMNCKIFHSSLGPRKPFLTEFPHHIHRRQDKTVNIK